MGKHPKTSEERMEQFRQKLNQDFGNMTLRNKFHLQELMKDKGYRKYIGADKREHYGYPKELQTQIAWDYLHETSTTQEILGVEFTYTEDKNKNRHANYDFEYNNKKYRKGQFIPKIK